MALVIAENTLASVVLRYMCFESEGGHAEYAPRTDKDIQMLGFMKDKFAAKCSSPNRRVSVERIVSGPGIANVYEFLETQHPEKVDPEFHDKFVAAAHDKKPQLVAENAASCELCDEAMNVFAGAFGSEAGVWLLVALCRREARCFLC